MRTSPPSGHADRTYGGPGDAPADGEHGINDPQTGFPSVFTLASVVQPSRGLEDPTVRNGTALALVLLLALIVGAAVLQLVTAGR
jgi:hypothetical protein